MWDHRKVGIIIEAKTSRLDPVAQDVFDLKKSQVFAEREATNYHHAPPRRPIYSLKQSISPLGYSTKKSVLN